MSRAAAFIAILLAGAAPSPADGRQFPLGDQGAVFVYLRPFAADAARLGFRVGSLAVVPEDGAPVPLDVRLNHVEGGTMDRWRQVGGGQVPPGRYAGLTLVLSGATLRGQDGPAHLEGPPGPVEVPIPFRVDRGQGVVLHLRIDPRASLPEGLRFEPAVQGQPAVPPPVARLGIASCPKAGLLTLYDKHSGEVAGVIPTGRRPSGMALDSRRRRAYVALPAEEMVIAVGLLEERIVERLRLQGGDEPLELALTPDGMTLLAVNAGSRTVSVIDPLSMVETGRITVGDGPEAVVVDPRGERAYVFNAAASSVTAVDVASRRPLAAIPTDSEPFRGDFSRGGEALYVIHRRSPFLSIIDPASLTVRRRVLLGTPATALKVDRRTDLLYVAPEGAAVIEVYDPLSFLPSDSLRVTGPVSFLAIDGEENTLHAGMPDLREVQLFPLVGRKIARRIDLGEEPYWVSVVGER